jgi:ABC-type polysaccharide/polyol phosphate transport system ATPase subunit
VVLTSHNHYLLRRMCNKALVPDHGSIRYFGHLEGAEKQHLVT